MHFKPLHFPHHAPYYYSRRGFKRVRRRLARLYGFTKRDLERIEMLYFNDGHSPHQDIDGSYRNKRKYKLHQFSRTVLKYDRKSPTFRLVERSGLFYVFYDEEGRIEGFMSPRTASMLGAVTLDRYARRAKEKG